MKREKIAKRQTKLNIRAKRICKDDELLFVTEKEVQDFLASNPQPSPAIKAALEALGPDFARVVQAKIR